MKVILTLSGGMDSAVLLWFLKSEGHEVRCLSVDYGQRHRRELYSAKDLCLTIRVEHQIINLSNLRPILAGSSQTSDDIPVPEGHYAEASMKQTIVPNRNMILLALAGAWAVSTGSDAVAYAAHAGDHAIYPDCRPAFADMMSSALLLCDWSPITLLRPFLKETKAGLVQLGMKLEVPFGRTWSCYKGEEFHCGRCGTCVERLEAFKLSGYPDPVVYDK